MEKLQNIKMLKCIIVVTLAILLLGWSFLIWNERRIEELDINNVVFAIPEDDYVFYIDNLSSGKDDSMVGEECISISGWIVKKGENTSDIMIKIVLKNTITDKYFVLPTSIIKRTDVTAYLNDGCNYDNCGYSIRIKQNKKINTVLYDYEVLILYSVNEITRLVPLETTLSTWGMK